MHELGYNRYHCPKYRMMIYDGSSLNPTDESRQLVSMEIHGSNKQWFKDKQPWQQNSPVGIFLAVGNLKNEYSRMWKSIAIITMLCFTIAGHHMSQPERHSNQKLPSFLSPGIYLV